MQVRSRVQDNVVKREGGGEMQEVVDDTTKHAPIAKVRSEAGEWV